MNPPFLLSKLSEIAGNNAIITTEVGQNQICAANYYRVQSPSTFISSGGMGTMGHTDKSKAFINMLEPFGIIEV
ncbi:thiamine pyrophosphate-dependent enzyme [Acetivibrio cellulolyticus]